MIRRLPGKEEVGTAVVLVSRGNFPLSPGRFIVGVLSNPIPKGRAGATRSTPKGRRVRRQEKSGEAQPAETDEARSLPRGGVTVWCAPALRRRAPAEDGPVRRPKRPANY
jgi:hypothetical protein